MIHKESEIERCENCGEFILDLSHDCGGVVEGNSKDKNYSDKLEYGFDLLNMED